jgi:hypothetical protein
MDMFKKFFVVMVALLVMQSTFAQEVVEKKKSTFSNLFYGCTFFSPKDVIQAYTGAWNGTQVMTVQGREIATALVDQNYISSSSNGTRLVGSGKITGMGASIPTRSFMYIENDVLCLDIRTQDGVNVPYIGIFSDNKIDWVPRYFFMTYDIQTDAFFNTIDGLKISSKSMKYVEIKQSGFEGYIQIDCTFRKSEVVYRKEKVNTSKNAKFVFPNAKMGE